MSIYRYVFIFAFTIAHISGSSSLAVEPTTNILISHQKNTSLDKFQNIDREKYIVLAKPNEAETIEETDKSLYLAGIALTLITFIFIVFLLFKPEKQQDSEEIVSVKGEVIIPVEDETISFAQKNNIVIIPDKNTNAATSDAADKKTAEPIFSMIGMEQDEELAYQPISAVKTVEIQKAKALEPGTSVAETLPELANNSEPKVNCDLTGKLTIIKSKTTKIDVVSELIQDLQKNSKADSKGAKDLRRKAIWKLGKTNNFLAIEHLIQIMPDVESLEKSLISDSITQIVNRSFATVDNVLLTLLENESIEVRKSATEDLIYFYQSLSSAVIHLSKMTENSNAEVRNTARWALKRLDKISFPTISIDEK